MPNEYEALRSVFDVLESKFEEQIVLRRAE